MVPFLKGHRVLIAEDEPRVALDLANAFELAGAETVVVHDLKAALDVARVEPLSAAVVDVKLKTEISSTLCALLQCRSIPFIIYTGYPDAAGFNFRACVMLKPNRPEAIVEKFAFIGSEKFSKIGRQTRRTLAERVARSDLPPPQRKRVRPVFIPKPP